MPATHRKSLGQSPRTPYSRRHGTRGALQQRGVDHYFPVRNILNVRHQREAEPVQAAPPPPPPPPPPDTGLDALPDIVLRAILAMLPATDLFLSANRVCKQWRRIISDEGFCRWKKRYFCYHRQGEAGKQEVMSILQKNHMSPDNNLCLLYMARYMRQIFHQIMVLERDKEEKILECIRRHRLYKQARACIPGSMTQMGEDPWLALALMLVLADGVGDVWKLVVCLRRPLTPELLSEFLWCAATLLRAMADARVRISNRLHYNIFYVLHLMENILPSNNSEISQMENCMPSDRESQMTPEQQQILNHNTERDHVVKIMAFAGTGKTTTLVCYAKQRPQLRFLYVVFSKPAQAQALRIFPSNVVCKTIHSLAHAAVGQRYHEKLRHSSLNIYPVFQVMPEGQRSIVWAKVVTKTIKNFWASTDPLLDSQHVPEWYKSTTGNMCRPTETQKKMFLNQARHIWEKMKEVEPTSEPAYGMYHDGYLKLWQLEGARMEHYDVIFIDEVQDCTPVIMDILLSQPCARILVGDPYQHIYSFRGAINNLHTLQHTHIYYLTQSFRFGPEIAYVGATILQVGKNVRKTLVGGDQEGSVRGQDAEMRRRFLTGVGGADGKLAILSRTNAYIFHEAVRLLDLGTSQPLSTQHPQRLQHIHIIGGTKAFGLKKIHDIWILKQGDDANLQIEDSLIRRFSQGGMVAGLGGYHGLRQYAEITEDQDLLWKIDVVDRYGQRIPELLELIRGRQTKQEKADFILGTMHKAKGLEFDTVFITDDFRALQALPAQEHGRNQIPTDDDWNLIYMAVTRAKRTLFITRTITDILARAGEYFLRSQLTTVPADNSSPQCSFPRCPIPINTNTHLCMCRLPITYVDGVEKGGAVCLPCVNQMAGHLAFLMSPGLERIPFPLEQSP